MFQLVPRQRNARQTAGRNLTDILRLKQENLGNVLGEVDEYGKRTRGADIMEQIAGMTPEEKAKADLMGLGGKNTQSEQTMNILKDLTSKQEKETDRGFRSEEAQKNRDFQAGEGAKSRAGRQTLAKLKGEISPVVSQEEQQKAINLYAELARKRNELATGMASKNATPKAKAAANENMALIDAEIDKIAPIVFPNSKRSVSGASNTGGSFIEKLLQSQLYNKNKK